MTLRSNRKEAAVIQTAVSSIFSREAALAAAHYAIGDLRTESPAASGVSSEAKVLETDRGRYVLRRLSGEERMAAHRFYLHQGYTASSTGFFRKIEDQK